MTADHRSKPVVFVESGNPINAMERNLFHRGW
jgi:hypothetical protein